MRIPVQTERGALFVKQTHGTFAPSAVYLGENFRLQQDPGNDCLVGARVWRVSPQGIDLCFPSAVALTIGEKFNVHLSISGQRFPVTLTVVTPVYREADRDIAGFSMAQGISAAALKSLIAPPSDPVFWKTSCDYIPTAFSKGVGQFKSKIYYQVAEISAQGLILTTDLFNTRLVPGFKLLLRVQFPPLGSLQLMVVIHSATVAAGEVEPKLRIRVAFTKVLKKARQLMGQYLLQFGSTNNTGLTPRALRKSGLLVRSVSAALDFKYVDNDEEYQEVLNLRHEAYVSAGRVEPTVLRESFVDKYDGRSRIIIGRHHGKIVATVRLAFPKTGDPFEHSAYGELPKSLPATDNTVEIGRASTNPEYRNGDLFLSLLRFATLTVIQSGRRYILILAHTDLAPIYFRIGFKNMRASLKLKPFRNEEHIVCLGDTTSFLHGDINPFVWVRFFYGAFDLLPEEAFAGQSWFYRLRLSFYLKIMLFYRGAVKTLGLG